MGVTRFPYGISTIKPGESASNFTLEASATPSVANGTFFLTAASAITITNFAGGEVGQIIYVSSNSAGATTLANSSGGIRTWSVIGTVSADICKVTTAGNYLMKEEETMAFVYTGTTWTEIGAGVRVP